MLGIGPIAGQSVAGAPVLNVTPAVNALLRNVLCLAVIHPAFFE
jgi:hypothetical protein